MKIFSSCRLMYGKKNFSKFIIAGFVNAVVMVIGGLFGNFVTSKSARDFIDGFCTAFGGVIIVFLGVLVMSGAFSSVLRINPGYKYFHSLADGAGHFKRALICANLAALSFAALYAVVGAVFFWNFIVAYMISAALFSMGVCNLIGGTKHNWLKLVSLVALGFFFGSFMGVLGDNALVMPPIASVLIISVSLLFYVGCLIFTLIRIKKIWMGEN